MAQAVICPVCNGSGKVNSTVDTTAKFEQTCYGCGGKGWVEEPVFVPSVVEEI